MSKRKHVSSSIALVDADFISVSEYWTLIPNFVVFFSRVSLFARRGW